MNGDARSLPCTSGWGDLAPGEGEFSVVSVLIRPSPSSWKAVGSVAFGCLAVRGTARPFPGDSARWMDEGMFRTPDRLCCGLLVTEPSDLPRAFKGRQRVCWAPVCWQVHWQRAVEGGGRVTQCCLGPPMWAGPGPPVGRPWVCRLVIPVLTGLT